MKPQTKEKWKRKIKMWCRLILNWRFLICFGIGWMITNGWCYVMLGIGIATNTAWMITVAGAYALALWAPFTPEKIITTAIALFLVRVLFPKHNEALKKEIMAASADDFEKVKKRKEKKKNAKQEPVEPSDSDISDPKP